MFPPITVVNPESKMQLCELPMMSDETMGSSVYSRIPFRSPSAAARTAALTSSAVVVDPTMHVRSVMLPVATGTRRAIPVSFPSTAGKTLPTARAAPVDVGMMLMAAARERRGSEWS